MLAAIQRFDMLASWDRVSTNLLFIIGNSSAGLRYGAQDIPLPCPLALLLVSALVAPAEAPTLGDGAMIFDSWAVVISDSVIETMEFAASKD